MLITLKNCTFYWLSIKYIRSNFLTNYELILEHLRKLIIENFNFQPIKPKISDLVLVALNISAEFLSINYEYQLFRVINKAYLFDKIERIVYNKKKRKLFTCGEQIRNILATKINKFEAYFIVNSMPLEVCKL